MEENIIAINWANFVSITIMAAAGFVLVCAVKKFAGMGKPSA
jgi:hypothetical protein